MKLPNWSKKIEASKQEVREANKDQGKAAGAREAAEQRWPEIHRLQERLERHRAANNFSRIIIEALRGQQ